MTREHAAAAPLKRTPLYEQHQALGARMVEFGGWEMPLQYSSILEEHRAVRMQAGLFDVSHMGEFQIEGPEALPFLQYLVPNDVGRLAINQALYTTLCLPTGGVIDDLLVYRLEAERYMVVVNAANIAKDLAWFQEQARRFSAVQIIDRSQETALLALQGPAAQAILQPLTPVDLAAIRYYRCLPGEVAGLACLISRTGYTGEDGFELYCEAPKAPLLWEHLLAAGKEHGLVPAGLGARDTLRLEAGYCLYGHELTEQTNPLEAGLAWTIKFEKGDFIGREALLRVREQGVARKLIGLEMLERRVPRGGYTIYDSDHDGASGSTGDNQRAIGVVTSGAPSPTLNKSIGMGYVEASRAVPEQLVQVEIGNRRLAARLVALPFYKRRK
ncbi:glycine cleavage system aminomethyltransferase GcvT [Thermogemmatispora sp.]|uniref:glycine cleavage system aminomethyltransferase GcvT n=1 Tax=Thermogemmatispora sp. TaxID=1968838 RepID=UPI001DDABED2|nr:glycine cleavage system aminomethyltransferase GcvT [Thermogemmatispora sp.]MBX5448906.1 glycine cleavage system aminomethyltransferase GcvT [Thermogemmatispora sp.]